VFATGEGRPVLGMVNEERNIQVVSIRVCWGYG